MAQSTAKLEAKYRTLIERRAALNEQIRATRAALDDARLHDELDTFEKEPDPHG